MKGAKARFCGPPSRTAAAGPLTIFIILGGIFTGVFTPDEAAGIAAVYSFLGFSSTALDLKKLPQMCLNVAVSTGVIMFMSWRAPVLCKRANRSPQEVIRLVWGSTRIRQCC